MLDPENYHYSVTEKKTLFLFFLMGIDCKDILKYSTITGFVKFNN